MKKSWILIMAALLSLGTMGCGTDTAPKPDGTKPQQESVTEAKETSSGSSGTTQESNPLKGKTLTLMMSMSESNSTEAYNAQIAAFEAKYECKVDVEAIPGGDEGENLKLVRLATNSLSDVYMCSVGSKLDELDPVNNCMDISKEPWSSRISDGYREVASYEGGIYATPADTSNAAGVLYNTKVFEDLNLSIPKTWDEFLACCEAIRQAGLIPVAAPYAKVTNSQIPFLMNYYYVTQENPDFAVQYTNREIDLNQSEAFLRGLQKMYDMSEYLNEDFLSTGMDECAVMLGEGSAAMMVIRTNILVTMEANCPEYIDDMGFFPLPDLDPDSRGVSYWLPMGYVINKNAKEPELAKAWCEFVVSQEGVDAFCSAVNPTGTFCLKDVNLSGVEMCPALVEAQKWVSTSSSPVMEYYCRIKGSNQATICSMCASGEITPEDACQQIMDDNVVDAQQKGFPGW